VPPTGTRPAAGSTVVPAEPGPAPVIPAPAVPSPGEPAAPGGHARSAP
jgi:hypothetical protein